MGDDAANDERARQNGVKAAETVRRFLTEMKMEPTEQKLPKGVAYRVSLDGPADEGVAQILTDDERFVFHFVFPGYVDPARRSKIAEFIVRANWALIEGNFELNMETGAVRYKVGIDFTYAELTEVLIRNAILSGMNNIEIYAGGLDLVRNGTAEPKEAYELYSPIADAKPQ